MTSNGYDGRRPNGITSKFMGVQCRSILILTVEMECRTFFYGAALLYTDPAPLIKDLSSWISDADIFFHFKWNSNSLHNRPWPATQNGNDNKMIITKLTTNFEYILSKCIQEFIHATSYMNWIGLTKISFAEYFSIQQSITVWRCSCWRCVVCSDISNFTCSTCHHTIVEWASRRVERTHIHT